eukprot:TRINITY_DN8801_c0_g1_i1.p1 TRINITY_DN8801_c0_g1~~TRINITY_DN8801_c0_g1_i1.p1  ORF type:complete len:565 (+),score=59.05 TRINITY_DN8801_c0_g1_i1:53-1696(+)
MRVTLSSLSDSTLSSLALLYCLCLVLCLPPAQAQQELVQVVESCVDMGACDDLSWECLPGEHCTLQCDGYHSCARVALHCGSSSKCELFCNGEFSCLAYEFHCTEGASCNAFALGDMSAGMNLFQCANSTCHESCVGALTCFGSNNKCSESALCESECTDRCAENIDLTDAYQNSPETFRQYYLAAVFPRLASEGFDLTNLLLRPVDGQMLFRHPITEAQIPLLIETFSQAYGQQSPSFDSVTKDTSDWVVTLSRNGTFADFSMGTQYPNDVYNISTSLMTRRLRGVTLSKLNVTRDEISFHGYVPSGSVDILENGTKVATLATAQAAPFFLQIVSGIMSAFGNIPKQYLIPTNEISDDGTSYFSKLAFGSSVPCGYPQPFQNTWCREGVWTAPESVQLRLPELFSTSSAVVYQQELVFTEQAITVATMSATQQLNDSPLNITVTGAVTMAGTLQLELEEGFQGGDIELIQYGSHSGEFESVQVVAPDCTYELVPRYTASSLQVTLLSLRDACSVAAPAHSNHPSLAILLLAFVLVLVLGHLQLDRQ